MLVASHRLIGKTIAEALSRNLDIQLDESSFKYGCMKPDIVPRLRMIPHYMDRSLDFVLDSIEALYNKPLITTQEDIKAFSVELGVVVHYISDYFCYAHNHHRYSFLPLHMVYENKLALRLTDTDLRNLCGRFLCSTENIEINDRTDWRSLLVRNYRDYMYSREGIQDDIWYAMKACTIVACLIASRCLEKEKEAAA